MTDSYVDFVLLAFSLMGWGILVFHKLKINVAFIPIFVFSMITCSVFFAGLLNIMPFMVYFIFFTGLILLGIYIYLLINNKYSLKGMYSPSAVIFILMALLVIFLLKGVILLQYDNFSHWGLLVKEMFDINGLPDHTTVITFKNYPPGSAVFIYFINKIIGYSESHALMAQGFLIAANLSVLLFLCNWKKPLHILLSLISGLTLITIIEANIYNLLVDTLLGLVALSITVVAYYYRKNWLKNLIVNTPLLVLLILIKDSGILFYLFNIVIILFFIFSNQFKGLKDKKNQARVFAYVLLFIIFIPFFTNFLWGEYTEQAYPNTEYEDNKFSITLESFSLSNIDKSEEAINNLAPELLNEAFNPVSNSNVKSLLYLNSLSIIFMLIAYIRRHKLPKLLFGATLLINFFYVAYIGLLYLMYLLLMPQNEMVRLAGFERYQTTIVIYCIGILMTVMILEWLRNPVINKNKGLQILSAVCLTIVFVFPFHEHINSIIKNPEVTYPYHADLRKELDNYYDKIRYNGIHMPNILYYSSSSENDGGYLNYVVLYEMLSRNFHISNSMDTKENRQSFKRQMNESDYIIVLDTDEDFVKFFSNYVSAKNLEGVYKITKKETGMKVHPVN